MQAQVFAILTILALAAAIDDDASPVTKVVTLLKGLKVKNVADGEEEAQTYNKFACWCETATKRKANDIHKALDDIRSDGQTILKLKGNVATLKAEIKEKAEQLQDNADEAEVATALRQKRNGKFMAMQAETKEQLTALQKAIGILTTGTALMQTDTTAQAMSAVSNVIEKLPLVADLNGEHMALLSEFATTGANGKYAPQSATIQGILQDMYTTFAENLESATMSEAKQNKNYETVANTEEKQTKGFQKVKLEKEVAKAKAESELAATTSTYDSTTEEMKANIKFFDEAKKSCSAKHAEYNTRKGHRDTELSGINKAIELLTSDSARKLFATSIKPGLSFIQTSSEHNVEAITAKAYKTLKAQATKFESLRLAMLAVSVRTAKAGHFDKVLLAIDGMMKTLTDEGAADLQKRDECKKTYHEIARDSAKAKWQVKTHKAGVAKYTQDIEFRAAEKAEASAQLVAAQAFSAKLTKDRKASHSAFEQAKLDDTNAIKLLNQAKSAFGAFFKKEKIKLGLVEAAQDPEFAVSEDRAPDATLSTKDENQNQAKGIVSLFNYIIEDLEGEVSSGVAAEIADQTMYEEQLETANALEASLTAKITSLKSIIDGRLTTSKGEQRTKLLAAARDLKSEVDYKATIQSDCDWMSSNFDGRAEARAGEMDGLVSAKESLARA